MKVVDMIKKMDIQFRYHHYKVGEAPAPPYLLYYYPNSNNFGADNKVYHKQKSLNIELYTELKKPELEEQVETVLDESGFFYDKFESYIEDEDLYEVLYTMEVNNG